MSVLVRLASRPLTSRILETAVKLAAAGVSDVMFDEIAVTD